MTISAQDRYEDKHADYASFGNGALARAVRSALPERGSVLDLGCATGGLLAACDGVAGRRVGVELSPTAAAAARAHSDEVHVASVESDDLPFGAGEFDVVVLGDILEHLPRPEQLMASAAEWCRHGGTVVASTPNVAYWQARWRLARGQWTYENTGIFDTTHLRFFTRATLRDLFLEAGLGSVQVSGIVPMLRNHMPVAVPAPVERRWQQVGARYPELLAFQLLSVATRG